MKSVEIGPHFLVIDGQAAALQAQMMTIDSEVEEVPVVDTHRSQRLKIFDQTAKNQAEISCRQPMICLVLDHLDPDGLDLRKSLFTRSCYQLQSIAIEYFSPGFALGAPRVPSQANWAERVRRLSGKHHCG